MVKYHYPAWYSIEPTENTDWKAWEQEAADCERINKDIFAELASKKKAFLAFAKETWGASSNAYKYVDNKMRLPQPPSLGLGLSNQKRRYQEKLDKERLDKQKIEKVKKDLELIQAATSYLLSKSKRLNVDFTLDTAVFEANSVRLQELIEEYKHSSGEYIEFGGDYNCENCAGWDGESRRCECGNRRVCWGHEGNFQNMYVYAEAY